MTNRQRGSPDSRNPPEELTDDSPLIRDETKHDPKGIGPKQIRKIVHKLYVKADLLKEPKGRMYKLRTHSLRNFSRTQLNALGVNRDYIEYMMGHKISGYHDIQMKGVELLRGIYAASGLCIRPRTKVSKIEAIKEIIRALGMNPEEVLAREAINQPAITYIDSKERSNTELTILSKTLKELLRQEANTSNHNISANSRCC